MDAAPFSDTGMIVFGIALLGSTVLILVATFAWLLFGRRNRVLGSCAVMVGGVLLAVPVLIVGTVIASMV